MPDDNYIVSYTIKLNPGNTSDAMAAGKQYADAFTAGFKPNLTIRPDMVEKSAKDSAKVFSSVYSTSLTRALEESLKFVGPKGFPTSAQPSAQAPAAPRHEPAADLAKNLQPFLSGVEALSLLLRGAPITSVAQMAGQAYRDFAEIRRASSSFLTGGRPGESREAAITRRLEGAGAAPEAAAEAAAGGTARIGALIASTAVRGAGLVGGAFGVEYGLNELKRHIVEVGLSGAETTVHWNDMAKTIGMSEQKFAEMNIRLSKSGVSVMDLGRMFTRLAITANKEMPEIQRAVVDSANTIEEADIRVADAERGVVTTHLDRQAAAEHVMKTQGELVKVQLTGADVREQQVRAAQLSVSGAQLGLRAAQVQTQFAPEDQRLADIRGTLGLAGARLNVKGADLSVQGAQARLAEIASGQREDPDAARVRQLQQAMHGVEAAELNARQARLRVQEAKEAEEKRHALPGPEEQAAQAEQQARLHVDQTTTAQQRLEVDQAYVPLQAQINEALRARIKAQQEFEAAPDRQEQARIALEAAQRDREKTQYADIVSTQSELQKIARGEQPTDGFDIRQVPSETIRRAVFNQGQFQAGPIQDFTSDLLKGLEHLGVDVGKRTEVLGDIIGGGGRGFIGGRLPGLRRQMEHQGPLSPEEQQRANELRELMVSQLPAARKAEDVIFTERAKTEFEKTRKEVAAIPQATRLAPEVGVVDKETESQFRTFYTGLEKVDQIGDSVKGVIGSINSFGSEIGRAAGAAASFADKVQALILPSPKTETTPATAAPSGDGTEVTEGRAEGGNVTGLISGPGSETSDSIPINASRDEFIVKAERVRQLGVPFLNDLNEGRIGFQTGGHVSEETTEQKLLRLIRESAVSETGEQKRLRLAREARAKYLKSVGYQTPKGTPATLEGYGGDDSKASKLSLPDRIALTTGVAPPTEVTPENMRKFFGGFANAEQVRQAARSRKPDFDVPDSKAQAERRKNLEAAGLGYLMPKAGVSAQDYLKRLRSGETPESIRVDDAAARERATMITKENPFFGKTPEEAGAIRVPGLVYAPDTPLPPPKPYEIKPDVFMPVPEPPPREPEASFAERFDAGNYAAGGLVGMQSGGSIFERLGQRGLGHRGSGQSTMNPELMAAKATIEGPAEQMRAQIRAAQQMVRGYASGGFVGGFADHLMTMPGYAEGGVVAGRTGGGNTLSYHQLDLRTNAGTFRAGVSQETMDDLRSSGLAGKLSQTGQRPTWYS